MRCRIEVLEKKIGKLAKREGGEKEETRRFVGEERIKGGEEGRKDSGMEERLERMEKIIEREKREKRRKNIIIKGVSKKMNDVRRVGKEIEVEMDIEEIKKIRTGREENGGIVIVKLG